MKDEIVKPETVTDYNGRVHKIKDLQATFINYPGWARKAIDDFGTPYLSNVVHAFPNGDVCPCTVEGNGTLLFPLRIKFCKKHKAVNDLFNALQEMLSAHDHIGGVGRDAKKKARDKALAAIKKATE